MGYFKVNGDSGMRRPETYEEKWTDSGLVCTIDPIHYGEGRYHTTCIPWPQVRAIWNHVKNGGTIHNCPIVVDRWAMGEIIAEYSDG